MFCEILINFKYYLLPSPTPTPPKKNKTKPNNNETKLGRKGVVPVKRRKEEKGTVEGEVEILRLALPLMIYMNQIVSKDISLYILFNFSLQP